LCLQNVGNKLINNSELDNIVRGENSHDDKKEFFINIFKDYISDYYSDRMDFYKKVNEKLDLPPDSLATDEEIALADLIIENYEKQRTSEL
jgi:ABC-type transporter MlaC component